jgi:hypothetical protein
VESGDPSVNDDDGDSGPEDPGDGETLGDPASDQGQLAGILNQAQNGGGTPTGASFTAYTNGQWSNPYSPTADPYSSSSKFSPSNPFPELSLNLDPSVTPYVLAPDSLSLSVLDTTATANFTPTARPPNPFPDLSLHMNDENLFSRPPNVENFNYDAAMRLGMAIAQGLPLSLAPVTPDNASITSINNWFSGVSDVARMYAGWLSGTAPPVSAFGPESQQTQDMMSSQGIEQALQLFLAKNTGLSLDQQQAVTDYGVHFGIIDASTGPILGFNPGGDLLSDPASYVLQRFGFFGTDSVLSAFLNPTQQFVGSYVLDLYPQADGTVLLLATNVTSVQSLLLGLTSASSLNQLPGSVMGNYTQIYVWTVPNPALPAKP